MLFSRVDCDLQLHVLEGDVIDRLRRCRQRWYVDFGLWPRHRVTSEHSTDTTIGLGRVQFSAHGVQPFHPSFSAFLINFGGEFTLATSELIYPATIRSGCPSQVAEEFHVDLAIGPPLVAA